MCDFFLGIFPKGRPFQPKPALLIVNSHIKHHSLITQKRHVLNANPIAIVNIWQLNFCFLANFRSALTVICFDILRPIATAKIARVNGPLNFLARNLLSHRKLPFRFVSFRFVSFRFVSFRFAKYNKTSKDLFYFYLWWQLSRISIHFIEEIFCCQGKTTKIV